MRRAGGRVRLWTFGLALLAFFLVCELALQALNRAYTSEFARAYDEAGHYVTSLMVRDFLGGGDWTSPMAFAEEYYLHYPKVAIGHWPPAFHLAQGVWTLLVSPSRTSVMVLMALFTAAVSLAIYRALRPEYGVWAGVAGGLLFLLLPLVQAHSGVVMAEVPLALVTLLAALCFGRYLDTEKASWAAGFALFAVLAILTKPNGLALALLPPLGLLLTGRYRLARRLSFWMPAVAVALLCGPWYYYTLDMLRNGPLAESPQWAYTVRAVPTFSLRLVGAFGLALSTFGVLGFVTRVVWPARRRVLDGKWAALAGLVVASLVFHWIVPANFNPRHLILALPAAICLVVAGVVEVARYLPLRLAEARRVALAGVVAAALFGVEVFSLPGREWRGFGAVTEALQARRELDGAAVLISSDPLGEGALVSEVAMRDRHRRLFVLRGSKVLATSRWDGSGYRMSFETSEELWEFLREMPIEAVVVDRSVPERFATPDQALLRQTLEVTREEWRSLGTFPLVRDGREHRDAIAVWTRSSDVELPPERIRIDLTEMLGRHIGGSPASTEHPR